MNERRQPNIEKKKRTKQKKITKSFDYDVMSRLHFKSLYSLQINKTCKLED